jgi:hypothetical protein
MARRPPEDRRSGVAALEFALMAPVMLVMLLGVAELARYIWLEIKLQNAAASVGDLIARSEAARAAEIDAALAVLPTMLRPFDAGDQVRLIVTAAAQETDEDPVTVVWRREIGLLEAQSALGAVGAEAQTPADLVVSGGDALIVAEIFYRYEPWLFGVVGGRTLQETAFYRPRRASLTRLD